MSDGWMRMVGKPVARVTLREQASQALREMVVQGVLEPGSRINEVQLAAELGISRGPLREAIQGLAREGLLEVIQHRGAFVCSVDERSLRELYALRIALETYVVRLLATGVDADRIALLRGLLPDPSAASELSAGYPADRDFHRGLFAAAGNAILAEAADDVQRRISVARARSARDPERAHVALDEHRTLIAALEAGNGEAAVEIIERHLWRSFDNAIASLRSVS